MQEPTTENQSNMENDPPIISNVTAQCTQHTSFNDPPVKIYTTHTYTNYLPTVSISYSTDIFTYVFYNTHSNSPANPSKERTSILILVRNYR